MSDSLRPHESQHTRPCRPSPTPGAYPNSCPLSRWCHPTISSSVVPISSCPQPFPASGSFQMSQLFALGGQSIGVSASISVLNFSNAEGIKKQKPTTESIYLWGKFHFFLKSGHHLPCLKHKHWIFWPTTKSVFLSAAPWSIIWDPGYALVEIFDWT